MSQQKIQVQKREIYGCFKIIGLLGINSKSIKMQRMRDYAMAITQKNPSKTIPQCMQVLQESAQEIEELHKNLIFIHAIIQSEEELGQDVRDFLVEAINKILSEAVQIVKNIENQTRKSHIFSMDKAFNWIKERVSSSQQKKKPRAKVTDFSNVSRTRSRSQLDQKPKNQSRGSYLFHNLIVPYASFLQKRLSNPNVCSQLDPVKMSRLELWNQINTYKLMVKTTDAIVLILRYYALEYEQLVIFLIKMFDHDLKSKYHLMQQCLKKNYSGLVLEHTQIIEMKINQKQKNELRNLLVDKFGLEELHEIIKQIGVVNQGILKMYYGRYHFDRLQTEGIQCVKLYPKTNDLQLVYLILDGQKKKINRSKSKTRPKQDLTSSQMANSKLLAQEKMKKSVKLTLDKNRKPFSIKYIREDIMEPTLPNNSVELSPDEGQNKITTRFKELRKATTTEEYHKRGKLKL